MRYLKNVTVKSLMIATFVSLGLTACSEDDSSGTDGQGTANLTVRMTDAPGDYEEVNIDVQDVQVQVDSETEAEVEGGTDAEADGWVSLSGVQTGVYDLLKLTGGITQILADSEVPAGYMSQIRLVLGSNNTIKVDGETKPLNTPSAQQSGLKLQVNEDLEDGENYAFLLDFDVEKSIVAQGNGGYSLKPVIRINTDANAGMVIGTVVVPADLEINVQSLVTLSNGEMTISAYTDAEGNFALNAVPVGVYSLEVVPEADANLMPAGIGTVEVKANETTDLGEISL